MNISFLCCAGGGEGKGEGKIPCKIVETGIDAGNQKWRHDFVEQPEWFIADSFQHVKPQLSPSAYLLFLFGLLSAAYIRIRSMIHRITKKEKSRPNVVVNKRQFSAKNV